MSGFIFFGRVDNHFYQTDWFFAKLRMTQKMLKIHMPEPLFLVSRVSHPSAQINIIYSEVLNCKINSNLTFQISILTCFLDKQKRYLSFDRLSELIFFLHFCKRKKAKKQNFLKNLIPHKFRHVRTYHFYTDFAAVLL